MSAAEGAPEDAPDDTPDDAREGLPEGAPEALRETVSRRLHQHGQRMTRVRATLLAALAGADRPLTIPELLEREPDLAQSSAYRNLVVLEQVGVVHRIVTDGEFARYELAEHLTSHHHHLVCSSCGRVDDLPTSDRLERSVAAAVVEAAQALGFRADHHRLDLVGLCAACS